MTAPTALLDWILDADPLSHPDLLPQAKRCLLDLVGVAAVAGRLMGIDARPPPR